MQQSEMHYLPLSPGYFSLLVGAFEILLLLIQFGSLRYARQRGRSDRVIICQCPLLAPWRTWTSAPHMSAFGGKADMTFCGANVR